MTAAALAAAACLSGFTETVEVLSALLGVAGLSLPASGRGGQRRLPGAAGHRVAQGSHGIDAAFAGGVDVAPDVQPVLGDVLAGQAARDFLLCFGWPQVALADVVRRPDPGVVAEPGHLCGPVAAELQQIPARVLAVEDLGPRMRGTSAHPASTAWRNSLTSGSRALAGISGSP